MYAVVLTYILLRELDCYVCYLVVERGMSFSFVLFLCSHPLPISMVCKIIKTGVYCFFPKQIYYWFTISPISALSTYRNAENVFTRSVLHSDQEYFQASQNYYNRVLQIWRHAALNFSTETEQKGIYSK